MAYGSGKCAASHGGVGEEPANALFSRLLDDSVALVKNEIALVKAELRGLIDDFKMAWVHSPWRLS